MIKMPQMVALSLRGVNTQCVNSTFNAPKWLNNFDVRYALQNRINRDINITVDLTRCIGNYNIMLTRLDGDCGFDK